jgi:hypothetical protein
MKNINLNIAKFLLVIAFLAVSATSFGYVSDVRREVISKQINKINSTDYSVNTVSDAITAGLKNDEEKVVAVYLWLVRNIKYDYPLAKCDACNEARENYDTYKIVYRKQKGVCSGISNLFKFLVNKQGIRSYVVGGTASSTTMTGSHAWNMVNINNSWSYVDITLGLGNISNKTPLLINKKSDFINHTEEYIYVSYSSIEDRELYEGMDYLHSYVNLYNTRIIKYIKSNKTSKEIADDLAVNGLAPSDAIILEAKFIVELRASYNEITNTLTVVTTTPKKVEAKKTVSIPRIITMSNKDFRNMRDYTKYTTSKVEMYEYIKSRGLGKDDNFLLRKDDKDYLEYVKLWRGFYKDGLL